MNSDSTSNSTTRQLEREIDTITREIEDATRDGVQREREVRALEDDLKEAHEKFTECSETKARLTRKLSDLQIKMASEVAYLAREASRTERRD